MASDAFDFVGLVAAIRQADTALAGQAAKAVNVSLTLRNWFIGYYIAEFELQGADRANYGEKLLTDLSGALRKHTVSNTGRRQLYAYLAFYRVYPQIVRSASALSAQIVARPLLEEKVRTLSAQFPDAPATDPENLIGRLSYSHLEQLVELEDPLQRRFYEIETLRGNWSVRELKRQIASLYYQRSGLSQDKAALSNLAQQTAEAASPAHIIRDPYPGLLRDLTAAIATLQALHQQAVADFSTTVRDILQHRSRDTRLIEHTLDHLLDHACIPQGLACLKSLCRYYWQINPQATANYIFAYREMWGAEADDDQETGHV